MQDTEHDKGGISVARADDAWDHNIEKDQLPKFEWGEQQKFHKKLQ
jgi:hypothetical protein